MTRTTRILIWFDSRMLLGDILRHIFGPAVVPTMATKYNDDDDGNRSREARPLTASADPEMQTY